MPMKHLLLAFLFLSVAEICVCIFWLGIGTKETLCIIKNNMIAEKLFAIIAAMSIAVWLIIFGKGMYLAATSISGFISNLPF
jgi:hypothetical protein